MSCDQVYNEALMNALSAFGGTLAAGGVLMIVVVVSFWVHGHNRD
jgi:hypothetical protein